MTGTRRTERIVAWALVLALHSAACWWLLAPDEAVPGATPGASLATFDIPPPAPASPPPLPAADDAGRSSVRAPARTANPTPLAAPPVIIVPPSVPLLAAPVAGSGIGAQADGAATSDGNGSGAEGAGAGAGAGAAGTPARLIRGVIRARDYPAAERRARIDGVVTVRFTVTLDGRAIACRTMRSSGNAALDATTCRLIEQRFGYAPARDANGAPHAEERGWEQRWWIDAAADGAINGDAPPPGP